MPSTVTPRIYTAAFPAITNSLKYVLYNTDDPLVEVDSQTFAAPHPARTVSFPGLDRVNYTFKLLEMVGATPVAERANFQFNPDNSDFLYRTPENIRVGTTAGWIDGSTSAVLDGSGGKADWRGWEPIVDQPGIGPLLRDVNYTWDSVTGTFMLIDGNTLYTDLEYRFDFQPQTISASPGVPGGRQFTTVLEVTEDTTLTADDMGKKILINPASNYIEITMPDISTVVANRVTWFETVASASMFGVRIKAGTGATWGLAPTGRTDMWMAPGETFEAYKNASVYRVQNPVGNFIEVGRQFSSDRDAEENAIPMDGSTGDTETYARIWNDYVLQLDAAQVVTFADWEADPTKQCFWSLGDGGLPELFHFPDRRDRHERNTGASNEAGEQIADDPGAHSHVMFGGASSATDLQADKIPAYLAGGYGSGNDYRIKNAGTQTATLGKTGTTGTGETKVKSYYVNKFVKI